jgi:hypothetical protein
MYRYRHLPLHSNEGEIADLQQTQTRFKLVGLLFEFVRGCFAMANAPSKLEPFRKFIANERKRHTTYRRIAELLGEKGIDVDYSTIHAFVKVRSKPRRAVITMWEGVAENASATSVSAPQVRAGTQRFPKATDAKHDAIERLKKSKPPTRRAVKGLSSYKPDAPLERLSKEEARKLRDKLHS